VAIDLSPYSTILLDLDGTVYHEDHVLPGAIELIRRLQQQGRSYACLSNSTQSPLRVVVRLAQMGVDIDPNHVYTAAAAASDFVLQRFASSPGRPRAYNLATEGVQEMLDGLVDWVTTDAQPCDAVLIGAPANAFAGEDRQRFALNLLRRGALPVAVCNDRVYPSPRGLEFGSGALTAMMCFASNTTAVYCGKPQPMFFTELCRRLKVEPAKCVLIGDNLESDVMGAKGVGMKAILTLTGVTRRRDLLGLPPDQQPDLVVEDLGDLAAI
jgi:HAD superfamily hydrolase (TIGR01450 family)